MNRNVIKLVLVACVMAVLFVSAIPSLAAKPGTPGTPAITLQDAPKNGEIHIHVGEAYTLRWHVDYPDGFRSATALVDQQYPGRGISFSGADRSGAAASADLSLTMTGKEPTGSLAEGYAPISPTVVVRFGGGAQPYYQTFDLKVYVTP